jgi:endonuclease/exonuclease/phosphatase family metal-dependent hydrolase
LPGGSVIVLPAGIRKLNGDLSEHGDAHRIQRGMIGVTLHANQPPAPSSAPPYPHSPLHVYCTHLDHISEKERRTQLEYIARHLPGGGSGGSGEGSGLALLLGDMNALTRTDYSPNEWAGLAARHASKGWSAPAHGCLHLLGEKGYTDAAALAEEDSSTGFTAHVGEPLYRIDYCFVSPAMQQRYRVRHAQVLAHVTDSDHYPYCVDFEDKSADTHNNPNPRL